MLTKAKIYADKRLTDKGQNNSFSKAKIIGGQSPQIRLNKSQNCCWALSFFFYFYSGDSRTFWKVKIIAFQSQNNYGRQRPGEKSISHFYQSLNEWFFPQKPSEAKVKFMFEAIWDQNKPFSPIFLPVAAALYPFRRRRGRDDVNHRDTGRSRRFGVATSYQTARTRPWRFVLFTQALKEKVSSSFIPSKNSLCSTVQYWLGNYRPNFPL